MDDFISNIFEQIIKHAERLGALSSSGVLALACMFLGWKNYKMDERYGEEAEKRTELRIKDAEINLLMARALEKQSDAMEKQSDAIERIQIILDERLPGRNNHV